MAFAGLEDEGVLLGAFDHAEIGDPARLEVDLKDRSVDYSTFAEQIMGQ